jgi:hypothetical protein
LRMRSDGARNKHAKRGDAESIPTNTHSVLPKHGANDMARARSIPLSWCACAKPTRVGAACDF